MNLYRLSVGRRCLVQALALMALGCCVYLFLYSIDSEIYIAGCNSGSSCDKVLASRWSSWLELPVTAPAIIVYAFAFGSMLFIGSNESPIASLVLVASSVMILGSALWFLSIQAIVLKNFCFYCVMVHLCGLVLSGIILSYTLARRKQTSEHSDKSSFETSQTTRLTGIILGLLGLAALIGGQTLFAQPSHRIITVEYEGLTLDTERFPITGSSNAPHVLAYFFDYTCPNCRAMHRYLKQAEHRYEGQIAVVLIPVPGDASCNSTVRITHPKRRGACEYAKLLLAMWNANTTQFQAFHDWLNKETEPPPLDSARAYATRLVGTKALESATIAIQNDDVIDAGLQINEQVFRIAKENEILRRDQVPKLIINGDSMMIGLPKTIESFFEELERSLNEL